MAARPPEPQVEEGKWRGRHIVLTAAATIVLLVISVVVLCDDDDPPDPGKAETPDAEIVRVRNADVVSLPSLASPRLVLAGPHAIEEGEFLTTGFGPNAREGFLLKAVSPSTTTDDGTTVVTTEPASLFEAEPRGALVANPSDFEAEGASLVPLAPEPEAVFAALRTDAAERSFTWPLVGARVDVRCKRETALPGLRPKLEAHFEPNLDLRWNRGKRWKRRIETAEAEVRTTLTLEVSGALSAEFDCLLKPDRGVLIFFLPVPTPAGIPVPIRVEATGDLTAAGTVSSDKEGHVQVTVQGSAGVEYDGDRVKRRGQGAESVEATAHLPGFDPQATVGFRVRPGLAIEAGWRIPALGKLAAVAEMKLGTGVDLNYDHKAESRLRACVPVELQGGFHFNLPGGRNWGLGTKPKEVHKPYCRLVSRGRPPEEPSPE
ncbi:MAG TPA: hypothetical protein VJU14_04280 [Solirubrobacterales bacterium]|nr:hypothetical protein [Solirubrobacterales bacterium]